MTLPHDLTWREDPLGDRQWRQKLQMLRYVVALMYQWQATDDTAYRDRGIELMRSWIAANPYGSAASPSAWKDQVTAWRAMTMVCIAGLLPRKVWLDAAIADHGAVLADPEFYVGGGNHALNQSIGLLDVGCYLGRTDWQHVAARRIGRFIARTIDDQGVSYEQAVKYDRYDYERTTGRTKPIQGWISRSYGQREPAPVIEHRATGKRVRFLTPLAPFTECTGSHRPPVGVIGQDKTADGFQVTIDIDGRRELVVATGTSARISDAPGG